MVWTIIITSTRLRAHFPKPVRTNVFKWCIICALKGTASIFLQLKRIFLMSSFNPVENKVGLVSSLSLSPPYLYVTGMELMCCRNSQMSSVQEEKSALQLERQGLGNVQKGEYQSFSLQCGLLGKKKNAWSRHTCCELTPDWLVCVTVSNVLSCFIYSANSRPFFFFLKHLSFNVSCLTENKTGPYSVRVLYRFRLVWNERNSALNLKDLIVTDVSLHALVWR